MADSEREVAPDFARTVGSEIQRVYGKADWVGEMTWVIWALIVGILACLVAALFGAWGGDE